MGKHGSNILKTAGLQIDRLGSFLRKITFMIVFIILIWIVVLACQIYSFSSITSDKSVDAAIVLGAAVWNGQPSPVFEERIKHGIHLYQSGVVEFLIFTGGVGENDTIAESEVARDYAIKQGIPSEKILLEKKSQITYENLYEACRIMHVENMQTALVVSDPLHMKRSLRIAKDIGLDAHPSPTPTTRYQTWRSKSSSLVYEVFFYTVHLGSNAVGFVESCLS